MERKWKGLDGEMMGKESRRGNEEGENGKG